MAQLITTPFIQLPIQIDPLPLLNEVDRIAKDIWVEHRLPNLYSIPLVHHEKGTVSWSPNIQRLPSLRKLLHIWNAPLGESRVSILEPGASVSTHVDINYYWKHRLRVHIVLQTNPNALFGCDNHVLSLPAGQVWVSNNWAPHWIENKGSSNRIHIVIDTVGSPLLWKWIHNGWHSSSKQSMPKSGKLSRLHLVEPEPKLVLEKSESQVRNPAELLEIINDCIIDMKDTTTADIIEQCDFRLRHLYIQWKTLYYQYGEDPNFHKRYSTALLSAIHSLPNPIFWNGVDLHTTLKTHVGGFLDLSSEMD